MTACASESINSFASLSAHQLHLLKLMAFYAVIDNVEKVLSFDELVLHVCQLVRLALAEAFQKQSVELTEGVVEAVLQYNRDCLAQQALATVVRFEVDRGESSTVVRLTHAHAVELYIHLLPHLLCPSGAQPVSCATISKQYAAYASALGSARQCPSRAAATGPLVGECLPPF